MKLKIRIKHIFKRFIVHYERRKIRKRRERFMKFLIQEWYKGNYKSIAEDFPRFPRGPEITFPYFTSKDKK